MTQTINFLPSFNANHIEEYFSHDFDAIKSIFETANESLEADLDQIQSSFHNNDIESLEAAIHSIKPIFNILGLPYLEQQIISFHNKCLISSSVKSLKISFEQLWPELIKGKMLVYEQNRMFNS
jgi:hypothetical protein